MLHKLKTADRNRLAFASILLAIVFFVSLNILSNALLRNLRLDLTEDSRFTLSEGTKEVLRAIDEPIVLRLYESRQLLDLGPLYRGHADRVRELLDDYARRSGGLLRIERYDPQPFSPEEDLAVAEGLRGIVIDASGSQVFFGIAGHNSTDDRRSIPFLVPQRANFLEYDLTQLVHDLANPEKPVVGLLGDLPIMGSQFDRFQPWVVLESMRQNFEVRTIFADVDKIEDSIDILLLAQPMNLNDKTRYAIDQFVMRGGRVLAFVDPLSEVLVATSRGQPPRGSAIRSLDPLLAAWGVAIPEGKVIGDRSRALQVQTTHNGRQVVTPYLPWLALPAANMAAEDVVTGNLKQLNLRSTGSILPREGATTTIEPLVRSSIQAMEIDAAQLQMRPDPVALLDAFVPGGALYTLAARVTGPVKSAFPDGPPVALEDAVEDQELRDAHKAESDQPLNLVLVADGDLLADQTWVRVSNLLGQRITMPSANNGDFAVNALDNLSGSQGLISLRGRGLGRRPFEVLEAMAMEADAKYRAKEQALLQNIEETKQKIGELQREEQGGGIILTAAQQETVDQFRAEMIALRRELRDVQHALRQEVERLEQRIRFLNVWAVPLLVGVIAIVLAFVRRYRAARFQHAAVR